MSMALTVVSHACAFEYEYACGYVHCWELKLDAVQCSATEQTKQQ